MFKPYLISGPTSATAWWGCSAGYGWSAEHQWWLERSALYASPEQQQAIAKDRWHKCPFCNRRQDINQDGATCLRCGSDVMAESIV